MRPKSQNFSRNARACRENEGGSQVVQVSNSGFKKTSTKKGDPGNSGFEDASTSQTDIHNQMLINVRVETLSGSVLALYFIPLSSTRLNTITCFFLLASLILLVTVGRK